MKNKTVIGIRTHKWGIDEECLYKILLQYFSSDNIFIIVDEIYKEKVCLPKFANKISLNNDFLKSQNILDSHPTKKGLGWLCGDYFYYAMHNSVASEYYWLVEPDVGFTFDKISEFFSLFEEIKDDALVQSFQKSPNNWMWRESAELINSQAYKSFFPLTRLSEKAIIECKKARQELTKRLSNQEYPVKHYPNDEALVATVVGNSSTLTISNMINHFPNSFKYFTYMQSISVMPEAKNILPMNQVIHPIRSVEAISDIISTKISELLFQNSEVNDLLKKIVISKNDKSKLVEYIAKDIYKGINEATEITDLKIFLDKEIRNYPLLNTSKVWVWNHSTLVLDFFFINCTFTLEFELKKFPVLCNLFTRKGDIDIGLFVMNKGGDPKKNNSKIELFTKEDGESIYDFIKNSLHYFNNLFEKI